VKIYTRTGDRGRTGLFRGPRVGKDHRLIEAYGAVDELNAILGLARTESLPAELDAALARIQSELFRVGADLATPVTERSRPGETRVGPGAATRLEREIDAAEAELPALANFILPRGCRASAVLHQARTVCRRAERRTAAAKRGGRVSPEVLVYLNRLSDWLFVMARLANRRAGIPDTTWTPGEN
jgi:cob(I)alamin adenosyltransferase